ncbi:YphA family membrane protein [Ferviditalea candida]|uniref:Uncharacterized protein n=1 Tax=Ferviditalea candida TaxID=3108399 RepID=A0ABU5ZJW5_9BACL|nr:hypothetical protein [Paenibacillaceae bacterium T2]
MNQGYISVILICILLILLASGWRKEMAGDASHKGILLFFAGWIVGSRLNLRLSEQITLNLVCVPLLITFLAVWFESRRRMNGLHLVSGGIFMSMAFVLEQQISSAAPMMVVFFPLIDAALLLGMLAVGLFRRPLEQIAAVSLALLIGNLLFQIIRRDPVPIHLGDAYFQDEWWLTVVLSRGLSEILNACLKIWRNTMSVKLNRRRGYRE